MHELGHLIGLGHGGGDTINNKPNYLSVMNYDFQFAGLAKADDSNPHDFSRWGPSGTDFVGSLDENLLDESKGIPVGGSATRYETIMRCYTVRAGVRSERRRRVRLNVPLDFNCDGDASDGVLRGAFTITPDTDATPLPSYDDWANIAFERGWVSRALRASSGRAATPRSAARIRARGPAVASAAAAQIQLPPLLLRSEIKEPPGSELLKSARLINRDKRRPTVRAKLVGRTLTVRGNDNKRLDQVRVTIGKKVSTAFPPKSRRRTATLKVKLKRGRQRVTVVAIDAASNASKPQRLALRVR